MAKSQKNQTYVLKINTGYLSKHNWDLSLELNQVRKNSQMVVSLGSSQVLRWLSQIQGRQNDDFNATQIKHEIKKIKRLPNSAENKKRVCELYNKLYKTQFQPDYMMLVMDSKKDYQRALQGFSITVDGHKVNYKRLLGTAGGIKKSTIVFVNEDIHDVLMTKINNGRDMNKKFVAAKLNAYMALTCSGSIKVSWPRMIVVKDAITHFKSDVVLVDDSNDDVVEPIVKPVKDYEVEYNVSDGMGLASPEISAIWASELNEGNEPLSGFNGRCAFFKGMLITCDFVKFAEEVAHNYNIVDAWGDIRDVRDADVIVTVSMLKLWDSYPNYEAYYENCMKNDYDFAIAKSAPHQLKNKRTTNYQQLQDYKLTDAQIDELISPTVLSIKECLGLDWRKLILYMCGTGLDETTVQYADPMCKAIMANPELVKDPYVRSRVARMINKRINEAKIGVLDIEGDYAIICNDPYSLLQNTFGMSITGLLKAGECYHKYWSDKGVKEIIAARAPMTSHNNICKLNPVTNPEIEKWFKYIKTCFVFNSWDTTANRLNGADYDADTAESTNNKVLLEAFENKPTLMCLQRSANKCVPTEKDFVTSEMAGFGDTIGSVTNRATNMISLREQFSPDSEEYKILSYRIDTMMNYQQNAIDRIKGVVARPIPNWWLYRRENRINEGDSEEEIQRKTMNRSIAAELKPWFFMYRYATEKAKFMDYDKSVRSNCKIRFGKSLDNLMNCTDLTEEEQIFVENYEKYMPISKAPGTMNRICWRIEEEFNTTNVLGKVDFDHSILKNSSQYTEEEFNAVKKLYDEYNKSIQLVIKRQNKNDAADENVGLVVDQIKNTFLENCEQICPNAETLSNIVIDVCYNTTKNKTFAWDVAGEQIFKNVLSNSHGTICFPKKDPNGEIEFMGEKFSVCKLEMDGE